MSPERSLFCHAVAVATGFVTFLGSLIIAGLATGDMARAWQSEVFDVGTYWIFGLPVCYLAAGVLGYVGRVRTWRWILDMIGVHMAATLLFTGSGLNLWPLALVFGLVLVLPGIVTGWLGGFVYRFRAAMRESAR